MIPIHEVNPKTEVDVQESCNCWSVCCTRQEEKERQLTDKIRRIIMDELAKQPEVKYEKPKRTISVPMLTDKL